MQKRLIETYHNEEVGYSPHLITPRWQVAQLNYNPENAFYSIKKIDVHHHTDEAFVLHKGTVILIAAQVQGDDIEFETIRLKPGIIYNIPAGCWHSLMMSEDAEVIITEDSNTHINDFEFYYLNESQIQKLNDKVKGTLKGE